MAFQGTAMLSNLIIIIPYLSTTTTTHNDSYPHSDIIGVGGCVVGHTQLEFGVKIIIVIYGYKYDYKCTSWSPRAIQFQSFLISKAQVHSRCVFLSSSVNRLFTLYVPLAIIPEGASSTGVV